MTVQFTEEQLKAIDISRLGGTAGLNGGACADACIVAGPGSGKTTVLVERYRRLLESGIEPAEILAITFTEKASANMRAKLAEKFANDAATLRKLERASVSTIHGFCSRLLRDHATAAGVDPEFAILDEQLAVLEQAKALRETLDALVEEKPPQIASLLDATNGVDLERLIPSIYEALRAAGMTPNKLRDLPPPKPPESLERILAFAKCYVEGFPALPTAPQRNARATAEAWIQNVRACRTDRQLYDALGENAFNGQTKNREKDNVKDTKEQIESLRGSILDRHFQPERDLLIEILERFDALYRSRKFALAKLDYNDLEFYAVRLLRENPEVKRHVNQLFRQVMIDEFQDTSAQQSELVNLVRGRDRFYAVGDLNQSIYSFRHASPLVFNNYLAWVKANHGQASELVQNWRSRPDILRTTQLVLNGANGITQRDLIPARVLPPRNDPCIEVMIFERATSDDSLDESDGDSARELEAGWIVNRIAELRNTLTIGEDARRAKLNDFAILVRNSGVLEPFLAALTAAGLDYSLNRRNGFFETREAVDLTHLLRMIYNPRDEVSTLVVLRSDLAGVSDEGLLRLKLHRSHIADALVSAHEIPFDAEDRRRLDRFMAGFTKWREAAAHLPVDRLLLRALDEMGVPWSPETTRGANIEKLLTIARAYAQMTLGEFITHLEDMRASNSKESDSPPDETREAVQIMTTHAAKGLEFPVVILAAADVGMRSDDQSLNFTPQHGLGVKWFLTGLDGVPGAVHLENKKYTDEIDEQEANRLLYVALTRAQEHLIVSWIRNKQKGSTWRKTLGTAFGVRQQPTLAQPEIRTVLATDGQELRFRLTCTSAPAPVAYDPAGAAAAPEALTLQRPLLTDQFNPNTTATALSQFASCPRKYYLANYLGWTEEMVRRPSPRNGVSGPRGAAELGTQVHALLAGVDVPRPDWEATHLAQTFEQSALGKRSAKAKRREREWDFIFAVDPLIVSGTIDLWFQDAQGLTLVDYKTDNVGVDEVEERARDYALQIEVYAHALERALGKAPDHAHLYFLRPDRVVPVELNQRKAHVEQIARALTEAQEKLEFPLRVGPHCRHCDFYRTLCPGRLP